MYEFKFPDVGEGVVEGEILEWKVKEGDIVNVDQVIAKIETDKAAVDVPSPKAGKILKINIKDGGTVKVGEVLVIIGEEDESTSVTKNEPKAKVKEEKEEIESKKSVGVIGELEEASDEPEEKVEGKPVDIESKDDSKNVLATPAIRKLAKDKGVDINTVKGSGEGGRVVESDLGESKSTRIEPPLKTKGFKVVKKYDMYGYVERELLKGIRKITAKKMVESSTKVAAVSHFDEADITHLVRVRNADKAIAEKQKVKLTFLPFVIKAVINALKEHPYLNSCLDEETQEIVIKKYYNIGVAVDVHGSLIVPVIKGPDKKGILDIAKEIEDLAEKSRARNIDLADLKGGTFTITNIGSLGGLFATPIVNYPEAAILGLGRGYDKAVVIDGKIIVRKVLPLSLTFDHRILDGAEAAKFVNDIKKYLEDPALLLV